MTVGAQYIFTAITSVQLDSDSVEDVNNSGEESKHSNYNSLTPVAHHMHCVRVIFFVSYLKSFPFFIQAEQYQNFLSSHFLLVSRMNHRK